jgi:UDP-N-acetylmuramyl tripeptide synthase
MDIFSTALGKLVYIGLRTIGKTGSAMPGLVVERTSPKFLAHMLSQLPQGVVVVSGTNGKTTTTKIITRLLESQGLRVLTNPTGSNFVRGIISSVVDKASWGGKLDYAIAVFEQDEAHAVHFVRQVKPRGVLVLNVMRDQMDRFGEIDTTLKLLERLAGAATEFVVLNANDERVSTIHTDKPNLAWFGHSAELQRDFLSDDQLYRGEAVDFVQAAEPTVELTGFDEESASFRVKGVPHRYQHYLQGGHNDLNLAAALTVLYQVVPEPDTGELAKAILTLEPAFGRGEVIDLPEGGRLTLQLVKNPGGFTQALRMLELKDYQTVGICINDDYPDGRDVSWLWDVSFETIRVKAPLSHRVCERAELSHSDSGVLCGGSRAADMANRLKYDEVKLAGYEADIGTYKTQFDAQAGRHGGEAILFCTYTAMLKLRELYLGASGGLEEV